VTGCLSNFPWCRLTWGKGAGKRDPTRPAAHVMVLTVAGYRDPAQRRWFGRVHIDRVDPGAHLKIMYGAAKNTWA
jgi:hypothetical protein